MVFVRLNLKTFDFFQRSFTIDDRVAWAYVTIPEAALNGETVDDWFPLSGKQGDSKEGMINLVLTFSVSLADRILCLNMSHDMTKPTK